MTVWKCESWCCASIATRSRSSSLHCCEKEDQLMAWRMHPRRCWNLLDKALCSYVMIPTRAWRCCYVLYSTQTCSQIGTKRALHRGMVQNNISLETCVRSQAEAAFERLLDPFEGSPVTGKSVAGILNPFVDDLFGTGGTEMEQRVLARLKKRMAKLVQKTAMMCSSQDREFVGWKILS